MLRVFLSHTGELARFPPGGSFVQGAKDGVSDAGCVVVEQDHFAADGRSPGEYCAAIVADCDVFVVLVGFRYGSPVPGRPDRSYVELEYDAAALAGKAPLVFLLDADTAGLPATVRVDTQFGDRQMEFRERLWADRLCKPFTKVDELRRLVQHAVAARKAELAPPSPPPAAVDQTVTGNDNIAIGQAGRDVNIQR